MHAHIPTDTLNWTGLDELHEHLHRNPEDVAYLVFQERIDGSEVRLSRFDYQPAALGEDVLEPPDDLAVYADAAYDAFLDTVRNNLAGRPTAAYRVRAYGPKGERQVWSLHLSVEDEAQTEPEDLDADVTAVSPFDEDDDGMHDGPTLPIARSPQARTLHPTTVIERVPAFPQEVAHLGAAYRDFADLTLHHTKGMFGVMHSMMDRLDKRLDKAENHLDTVISSLLDYRTQELTQLHEREEARRSDDAKIQLAESALDQLGEVAKLYAMSQGLPADVRELLDLVSQHDDLMAALRDTNVRKLLADRDTVAALSVFIKDMAAEQFAPPSETEAPESPSAS